MRISFRLSFSMLVLVSVVGLLHPVFEVRAEEAPAGVPASAVDVPAASESAPAAESDAAAKTKAAEDSSVEVSLGSGGLKLRTRDGSFKFYFGGRVHVDGTYHLGDTPGDVLVDPPPSTTTQSLDPTDGAEIRRAR